MHLLVCVSQEDSAMDNLAAQILGTVHLACSGMRVLLGQQEETI